MNTRRFTWPELPAFRSPNFRLWFMGQSLSLLGTWITNLALAWLVYHLTNSAFWLGVVSFCAQAPVFALSILGGTLVDRHPRRQILLITQSLSMLQSLALAVMVLTGMISLPAVICLAIFQGIVNAFDTPARLSFAPDLLQEPESLANGIALFASLFSTTRFIGPAIAGMVIAAAGPGACFLLDGLSYLAALAALIKIQPPPRLIKPPSSKAWQQIWDGFVYAYQTPAVRSLLLLVSFVNLLAATNVLLPVVAREILQGGPQILGWLTGSWAVGALFGSLYLGLQQRTSDLKRAILIALSVMSGGFLLFGYSNRLELSVLAIAGVGCGAMLSNASSNTLLQTMTAEEMRGRVISLFSMAALGTMALASLLFGVLAPQVGVLTVYLICGGVCLLGLLWFPRHLA